MKQETKIKLFKVLVSVWLIYGIWCVVADCNRPSKSPQPAPVEAKEITEVTEIPVETPIPEPDLFEKYFGSEANIARAIAQAESGNRDVISKPNWNGSRDYGRMQINSIHADKVNGDLNALLDPETNIRVAKQIRDSWQGWNAWTVFRSGKYKNYL